MPELDRETERRLAAALYNDVWRLMEMPKRRPEQDEDMVHAAHASRYHWGKAGESVNLARGEWLCSRVYATLRRPEPAIWHAHRCLELLTEFGSGENWDVAAAYEALARAYSLAGNKPEKKIWLSKAREALKAVTDPDDRQPIEADLKTIK
jgi:lipopolysaccharide biosynthesis protein